MAHLVLTIDSDSDRRKQFVARALASLKSLPGLRVAQAEIGQLAVVWAHGISAPQSCHLTTDAFALLAGYAVGDTGKWLDAVDLHTHWISAQRPGEVFDGYHAAVAYSPADGLFLGVDILGLFPMYYAHCGAALVVGSSPELLAAHPQFQSRLDVGGLAGIFLTNGLMGGQALLQGVRRLGAGCQLRWNADAGTREVETFGLTPQNPPFQCSAESARELAGAGLLRAIRRHRPPHSRSTLMLSGGLDSRLMAGYLCAENITDSVVCLGRPTDLELNVGSQVAAALGMKVNREPPGGRESDWLESGQRVARWEQLAGGFSHLEMAAAGKTVGQAAPMFWSGFALDGVLAAEESWFLGETHGHFFQRLNRWGLTPEKLEQLLRGPQAGELIQGQLATMQHEFERTEESPAQSFFRMILATRVRFHIGTVLHRLSFYSWPLLPVLDRQLLAQQYNLPIELLLFRRLEKELLRHEFPQLSAIPREHNSFWLEPLQPETLFSKKTARLAKRLRRWYWERWRKIEPRRYYRCYDLNHPQWRAVRVEAENHRHRLDEWLDRKVLNTLLPPPTVECKPNDPFAEGSAHRTLLGLALWSAPRT